MARTHGDDHELLIGGDVGAVLGVGEAFTGIAAKAEGVAGIVDGKILRDLAKAVAHGSSPIADAIFLEKTAVKLGAGATKLTTIGLGGPSGGRYWEVTSIVVLGNDATTVVAGTSCIFCVGEPSNPVINDVRLPGTQQSSAVTIPASAEWGPHTFIVRSGQKAYVQVLGVAASQQVVCNLNGWDRPLWADNERSLTGPLSQRPDSLLDDEPGPRA